MPDHVPSVANSSEGGRWVRVGTSTATSELVAVEEAVAQILGHAEGEPRLVLLFASPAYDLQQLARSVSERIGPVPLLGCSTSGELGGQRSMNKGLTLWAMGGEGVTVATGMGQGGSMSLRQAATDAAHCLDRLERRAHTVLVLLADGLCGDQMEVVRGAYDVAGVDVPLVGGCAGDDQAMQFTQQIYGTTLLRDAVVAAAITSDAPLGIGVSHCWEPLGQPMLVTGSSGTRVVSLNDRSALDVYLDAFDAPVDVRTEPEAFSAFAATRPLGIRRRDRIEIRYVSSADFELRSLITIAEVPQGGLAFLMQGDSRSVLDATADACSMAIHGLQGEQPVGMLLFDCVARRTVLSHANIDNEIDHITAVIGDVPAGGFYTYGEIARTKGAGGFHNQTLVALAIA